MQLYNCTAVLACTWMGQRIAWPWVETGEVERRGDSGRWGPGGRVEGGLGDSLCGVGGEMGWGQGWACVGAIINKRGKHTKTDSLGPVSDTLECLSNVHLQVCPLTSMLLCCNYNYVRRGKVYLLTCPTTM